MKGSLDVFRVPCRQVLPAGPFDAVLVYNVYPDVDDPQERDAIQATPGAVAVSLGPRILRAETAAIAATSAWMAINGDWN